MELDFSGVEERLRNMQTNYGINFNQEFFLLLKTIKCVIENPLLRTDYFKQYSDEDLLKMLTVLGALLSYIEYKFPLKNILSDNVEMILKNLFDMTKNFKKIDLNDEYSNNIFRITVQLQNPNFYNND